MDRAKSWDDDYHGPEPTTAEWRAFRRRNDPEWGEDAETDDDSERGESNGD